MGEGDDLPILRGPRLLLRPLRAPDVPALAAILAEPEVARWWSAPQGVEAVGGELLEPGVGAAVELDGVLRGWVGLEEEDTPDYRHVALDIVLATEVHGRGLGPEALRVVIDHFVGRGHHRFTIDPAAANARAIHAYEKVGFRPVGRMRDYERAPDGSWRDGLLMDLLAGELPDARGPASAR